MAVGAAAVVSLIGLGWFVNATAAAEVASQEFVPISRSGYLKAYRYDTRLLTDKPPYFSSSSSTSLPDARVTNYLFFTNFEQGDPRVFGTPKECEGKYYSEWEGKLPCQAVEFVGGDRVEGPFHTNDATEVDGRAEFGRAGANPPDAVEIYGGTYPEDAGGHCTGKPSFHTATRCYVRGERIGLPQGTAGFGDVVESEASFSGETRLELDGTTNTIRVVTFNASGTEQAQTIAWPRNGLIYVRPESCGWPTASSNEVSNADGGEEARSEKGCGNVYVRGTYSKPLTIAAAEDLIINGSIYPTSVAGKLGAEPSGAAVLGLVAGNYVRIYHPCQFTPAIWSPGENGSNSSGSLESPWIYAAILSVAHSSVVDNFDCGSGLGKLNIYGAVAQNYRGAVGTGGGLVVATGAPAKAQCASRRRFTVHVVQIPGLAYRRTTAVLNGRHLATRPTKRGVTVAVDLRGRPKGAYVLRITVETTRGRSITGTRTYHTCAGFMIRPTRRATL